MDLENLKRVLNNQAPILPESDEAPNGTFISDGTEEDYDDYVLKEKQGWGGFYKKIFNLNKNDEANNE